MLCNCFGGGTFMSKLMHTPYRIGNIVISNRIVKSAMFEYCANQGMITDQHSRFMKMLPVEDAG